MLEVNLCRDRPTVSVPARPASAPEPLTAPDGPRQAILAAPDMTPADREGLLRLLERWRFPPRGRCPGQALIAEHGHWRLYVEALGGDAAAAAEFNRYWRRYAGAVLAGRFRPEDRDEIVAVFLARILRLVRPPFAWSCPFTTYLRALLLNVIRDFALSLGRRNRSETSLEGEAGAIAAERPAPGPSPEGELLAAERRRELEQAMARLPHEDRDLLRACVLEERGGQEVATRLGIRPAALYQRLCRAKRRLRQLLHEAAVARPPRSKESPRHDRSA